MQNSALLVAALLVSVLPAACVGPECKNTYDCPLADVCTVKGVCVLAPELPTGSGPSPVARATPQDPVDDEAPLPVGGDLFAGVIGGVPFTDPAPAVDGSSDGYVAYQVTSATAEGHTVALWFDIPIPAMVDDGAPHSFTLDQMMADGNTPCVDVWSDDGSTLDWADNYTFVLTRIPGSDTVDVHLDSTSPTSDTVVDITVPAFTSTG